MSANAAVQGPIRKDFRFVCCRELQGNADITFARADKKCESDINAQSPAFGNDTIALQCVITWSGSFKAGVVFATGQ